MTKGKKRTTGQPISVDPARLKSFVERIERLEGEKKDLGQDLGEIYKEAKNAGFDVKALRETIRWRRMDKAARDERLALIETYMTALGDFATTPLGAAGAPRAEPPGARQ